MGRKKITGDVLNARAKTNSYKRGAYREEDSPSRVGRVFCQLMLIVPFREKCW
jgi:hypothetical protein